MLLQTVLLFIGTVFFYAVFTHAENPGLNIQLSEKAFISASNAALEMAGKAIRTKRIPQKSGEISHIKYTISEIKVTHFSYGSPSVKFIPGKGTDYKLTDLSIKITGKITAEKWYVHTTASFIIDASHIGVDFSLFFGDNITTKKLTVRMGACSASVPKPSVHFYGGISFIINKFSGYFAGKIQNVMKSKICSSSTINTINADIQKGINEMPSNIHFMNSFYLNVDLLKPPTINTSVQAQLRGEVFWMNNHQDCPLPVRPMEKIPASTVASMITMQVSPYLLNSFAYVAHKNKIIRLTITSKNIPNKDILNTTCSNSMCIGSLIPEIGKLYPNQKLSVLVESSQMPDVYIKANNMLLDIYLSVTIYLSTDNPDKALLILPLTIHTEGKSDIVKQIIHFKLSTLNITLGVIRKGLPIKINEKQFQRSINMFVIMFILPRINKRGETGIPISTFLKANLTNTKLQLGLNSALLMTDVSLNPIEDDDEWTNQILQRAQTVLMKPFYGICTSLLTVLQTVFSDDPNKFYKEETILDNILVEI